MVRTRVYHATNSRHLDSFVSEGAKTDKSSEHSADQGSGFYVYTNRSNAENHALEFRDGEELPVLLSIDVDVNPNDWDIDYEADANLAIDFLAEHPELVRGIPDRVVEYNGWKLLTSKTKIMPVKGTPNKSIIFTYEMDEKGRVGSKSYWTGQEAGGYGIGAGELLGKIFAYLKERHSEEVRRFEEHLFSRPNLPYALKYTGKQPLKVENVEQYEDGLWVDRTREKRSMGSLTDKLMVLALLLVNAFIALHQGFTGATVGLRFIEVLPVLVIVTSIFLFLLIAYNRRLRGLRIRFGN